MEESAKAFNEMLESSKRPLHEHTELCHLDAISQVMALKAQFNLGRECYDAMMTVFGRFLPKGHVLPANLYQSDKMLLVDNDDDAFIDPEAFIEPDDPDYY